MTGNPHFEEKRSFRAESAHFEQKRSLRAETTKRRRGERGYGRNWRNSKNGAFDSFASSGKNGRFRARREGTLPDLTEMEHKVQHLMTLLLETGKRGLPDKGSWQNRKKEQNWADLMTFCHFLQETEKRRRGEPAVDQSCWTTNDKCEERSASHSLKWPRVGQRLSVRTFGQNLLKSDRKGAKVEHKWQIIA